MVTLEFPICTSHGPPPGRAYLECTIRVLTKNPWGNSCPPPNTCSSHMHFSWAPSGQGLFGVLLPKSMGELLYTT